MPTSRRALFVSTAGFSGTVLSSRKSAHIPATWCNINEVAWQKASGHKIVVHSNIFKYLDIEMCSPSQILADKELFWMVTCVALTSHPCYPPSLLLNPMWKTCQRIPSTITRNISFKSCVFGWEVLLNLLWQQWQHGASPPICGSQWGVNFVRLSLFYNH